MTYRRSTSVLMKGIRGVQLCHEASAITTVFDEANLVSCAELAPVMALAERAGLRRLVADHVKGQRGGGCGADGEGDLYGRRRRQHR